MSGAFTNRGRAVDLSEQAKDLAERFDTIPQDRRDEAYRLISVIIESMRSPYRDSDEIKPSR